MNVNTKHAVERFLMDSNMFHRTFGNNTLVSPEEWLEFERIEAEQVEAEDENVMIPVPDELNNFLERVYNRISNFVPIQLDNMAEFHIFLDLAQVFRRHSRDGQME
jgi:hypothetical protein